MEATPAIPTLDDLKSSIDLQLSIPEEGQTQPWIDNVQSLIDQVELHMSDKKHKVPAVDPVFEKDPKKAQLQIKKYLMGLHPSTQLDNLNKLQVNIPFQIVDPKRQQVLAPKIYGYADLIRFLHLDVDEHGKPRPEFGDMMAPGFKGFYKHKNVFDGRGFVDNPFYHSLEKELPFPQLIENFKLNNLYRITHMVYEINRIKHSHQRSFSLFKAYPDVYGKHMRTTSKAVLKALKDTIEIYQTPDLIHKIANTNHSIIERARRENLVGIIMALQNPPARHPSTKHPAPNHTPIKLIDEKLEFIGKLRRSGRQFGGAAQIGHDPFKGQFEKKRDLGIEYSLTSGSFDELSDSTSKSSSDSDSTVDPSTDSESTDSDFTEEKKHKKHKTHKKHGKKDVMLDRKIDIKKFTKDLPEAKQLDMEFIEASLKKKKPIFDDILKKKAKSQSDAKPMKKTTRSISIDDVSSDISEEVKGGAKKAKKSKKAKKATKKPKKKSSGRKSPGINFDEIPKIRRSGGKIKVPKSQILNK
jgi:hypothetical protein